MEDDLLELIEPLESGAEVAPSPDEAIARGAGGDIGLDRPAPGGIEEDSISEVETDGGELVPFASDGDDEALRISELVELASKAPEPIEPLVGDEFSAVADHESSLAAGLAEAALAEPAEAAFPVVLDEIELDELALYDSTEQVEEEPVTADGRALDGDLDEIEPDELVLDGDLDEIELDDSAELVDAGSIEFDDVPVGDGADNIELDELVHDDSASWVMWCQVELDDVSVDDAAGDIELDELVPDDPDETGRYRTR